VELIWLLRQLRPDVKTIADRRQHQRMVELDVTHAITEGDPLSPMAMSAKEMLAVARLRTLAAMGYDRGHEITACAQAATEAYVPNPSTAANTTHGLFGPERCSDDPQKDGYRGPAGAELTCRGGTPELGRRSRYYATAACRRCPLTDQCTSNTDGRRMTRWVDAPTLECMEDRRNATLRSCRSESRSWDTPLAQANTPMIRVMAA